MQLFIDHLSSPIGTLTLAWDNDALRALDFHGFEERFQRLLAAHYGSCQINPGRIPDFYRNALEAYFAGDLSLIETLPVSTNGTAFQRQVWAGLREIPAGTTMSYGELAQKIGKPSASRAVGRANGSNPVGIVVPCHRVIGADGSLTGYGGGMDRKRWLLAHERTHMFRLTA